MKTVNLQQNRGEAGFTLVELAIVMIIIGLLIGGILKGQELVANARVTATIAQIKGIDGAISTFRDKYAALPGDMTAPNTRLRDCTVAPCNVAGNGNGRITQSTFAAAPTNTAEGTVAFVHMAAADLISGIDISSNVNPPVFGGALPSAKISGGFWLSYTAGGNGALGTNFRSGHYLILNDLVARPAQNSGGLTATQAAQIDRKQDDGNPETGDVRGSGAGCIVGGIYAEADTTANCSLAIRVQS